MILTTTNLFLLTQLNKNILGGVYNSPEANDYWARRFGGLFGGQIGALGSLRNLQVILILCQHFSINMLDVTGENK